MSFAVNDWKKIELPIVFQNIDLNDYYSVIPIMNALLDYGSSSSSDTDPDPEENDRYITRILCK